MHVYNRRYGDVVVKTSAGMAVMCVYLIFSTLLFGKIVTTVASIPLNRHRRRKDAAILSQFGAQLSIDELIAICRGGHDDTSCSKPEFIIRMLVWLDRISVDEIEVISNKVGCRQEGVYDV